MLQTCATDGVFHILWCGCCVVLLLLLLLPLQRRAWACRGGEADAPRGTGRVSSERYTLKTIEGYLRMGALMGKGVLCLLGLPCSCRMDACGVNACWRKSMLLVSGLACAPCAVAKFRQHLLLLGACSGHPAKGEWHCGLCLAAARVFPNLPQGR